MTKNNMWLTAGAALVVVIAVVAVIMYEQPRTPTVVPPAPTGKVNTVTFACDGGKSITASFYPDSDTKVDLKLSDGRTLSLPHAISADGARYANADESVVFWNRGTTAFMTEGSATTFANCATPTQTPPPPALNLDKTFTDAAVGITFKYPSSLSTTYIRTNQWPPKAQVLTEAFTCPEGGSAIMPAGQSKKVTVGGNTYCLTLESEGAAGSVYTTYAYAFPNGDKVVVLTFILQFPQCLNYDDPQQTACAKETAAFNSDALIDPIAQSVVLTTNDYKNISYNIEGTPVQLTNGVAHVGATTTHYFGNDIAADLNQDGQTDVAFILTQDGGGSGTFFYVVAALKTPNGYMGTNGLLLGDRIAPQRSMFANGKLTISYATRKATDPMTATPTVMVSRSFTVSSGKLVEVK